MPRCSERQGGEGEEPELKCDPPDPRQLKSGPRRDRNTPDHGSDGGRADPGNDVRERPAARAGPPECERSQQTELEDEAKSEADRDHRLSAAGDEHVFEVLPGTPSGPAVDVPAVAAVEA